MSMVVSFIFMVHCICVSYLFILYPLCLCWYPICYGGIVSVCGYIQTIYDVSYLFMLYPGVYKSKIV